LDRHAFKQRLRLTQSLRSFVILREAFAVLARITFFPRTDVHSVLLWLTYLLVLMAHPRTADGSTLTSSVRLSVSSILFFSCELAFCLVFFREIRQLRFPCVPPSHSLFSCRRSEPVSARHLYPYGTQGSHPPFGWTFPYLSAFVSQR